MGVTKKEFGLTSRGVQASLYEITNGTGITAIVTDFGATLVSLLVPDRDGKLRDVVWGYEEVQSYEIGNGPYFGATVGRVAGRVGGAEATIGGQCYKLPANERNNCLHSGPEGYHLRIWNTELLDHAVKFSILSPDGDQGYPGNLNISVTYTLTEDHGLQINYDGVCDQDTCVNMTNHSYFNLNGENSDSILNHAVWIDADAITEISETLISTGKYLDVTGGPFDFRRRKLIGRDIDAEDEMLRIGGGYDHNYVLNKKAQGEPVAELYSADSGILMTIVTNSPGIQMYTGNFLQNKEGGKGGRCYPDRSSVAFETQEFPDAVHHDNFPSVLLKAGKHYLRETTYQFGCK